LTSEMNVLVEAFRAGGYTYSLRTDWIRQIVEEKICGRFAVDEEDFVIIWDAYDKQFTALLQKIFSEASKGTESIDSKQIPAMLERLNFEPMPGAISEMVLEVKSPSLGASGDQLIDYSGFVEIYENLATRAGLTRKEHQRLKKSFECCDPDSTGFIEAAQIKRRLRWHDRIIRPFAILVGDDIVESLIKEIIAQVAESRMTLDVEVWRSAVKSGVWRNSSDGSVPLCAFLLVCRMLHDQIFGALQVASARVGIRSFGDITIKSIMLVFDEIGSVSPSLLKLLEECGLRGKLAISFDEVYTLLLKVREKECFTRAERDEISALFEHLLTKVKDLEVGALEPRTICSSEASRALRFLCYCPSQYRFYCFMEKYGRSRSGSLGISEFTQLVSDYRFENIGMARDSFRVCTKHHTKWTEIPVAELGKLLHKVGHAASNEHLDILKESARVKNGKIDWREFLRLEVLFRSNMKETLKQNLGFTDLEFALLRDEFQSKDPKNTGSIMFQAFGDIVRKRFPAACLDECRKLVEMSDFDNNKKTEFKEYVWIMRRLRDHSDKRTMSEALKVQKELGYSEDEVHELRDLFKMSDTDMSGSIDFQELKHIFSDLVDVCGEAMFELKAMMCEVDANFDGVLNFWEFTRLMRIVQDRNWRNINGIAEGITRTISR